MPITGLAFVGAYLYGLLKTFSEHPSWGLWTYIAAFYLHPPMRWWGESLPDLRWSLTAAAATMLALPSAKMPQVATPWTSHQLSRLLLMYIGYMWIQLLWANPGALEGVILMSKYGVLAYLIYRILQDPKDIANFAFAHVMGCYYFGVLAYEAKGGGRLESVGGPGVADSNTLGMHTATGLIFAGALFLTERGWRRWAVLFMTPFIANCVVQTVSRGAFLGLACGAFVFMIMAPKVYRRIIISLGVLAMCVLLAYVPTSYWQRINTINAVVADDKEKIDSSAESRIFIAKAQFEMFFDHPLGMGFNTTTYLSRAYIAPQWLYAPRGKDPRLFGSRASHSTLLSIMTDQGAPGLILAGLGFLCVVRIVKEIRNNPLRNIDTQLTTLQAAAVGCLATSFVAGLATNYIKAEVQLWCLALLITTLQMQRDRLARHAAERSGAAVPASVPNHLAPRRA